MSCDDWRQLALTSTSLVVVVVLAIALVGIAEVWRKGPMVATNTPHRATTALPCAQTMPPAELDRQCKVYAARFIANDSFSPEERIHWADCEEAHAEYESARKWTWQRPY